MLWPSSSLSILKNGFRIVGLTPVGQTALIRRILLTTSYWSWRGIPLFLLSLVVLFSLVWLLRRLEIRLGSGAAIEDARMGKLRSGATTKPANVTPRDVAMSSPQDVVYANRSTP